MPSFFRKKTKQRSKTVNTGSGSISSKRSSNTPQSKRSGSTRQSQRSKKSGSGTSFRKNKRSAKDNDADDRTANLTDGEQSPRGPPMDEIGLETNFVHGLTADIGAMASSWRGDTPQGIIKNSGSSQYSTPYPYPEQISIQERSYDGTNRSMSQSSIRYNKSRNHNSNTNNNNSRSVSSQKSITTENEDSAFDCFMCGFNECVTDVIFPVECGEEQQRGGGDADTYDDSAALSTAEMQRYAALRQQRNNMMYAIQEDSGYQNGTQDSWERNNNMYSVEDAGYQRVDPRFSGYSRQQYYPNMGGTDNVESFRMEYQL